MGLIRGELAVVRGAGDLATGVILRLARSGFRVLALETAEPSAIRRGVALSEAVYDGRAEVEGLVARLASGQGGGLGDALRAIFAAGEIAVLVDPLASVLAALPGLAPVALVDAILAKRNLGTRRGMAPAVIALGPGFCAPGDVDAVVETNRGHRLGRVVYEGEAEADTGQPGMIGGRSAERVLRAPAAGILRALKAIGDEVAEGETVAEILAPGGSEPVVSPLAGTLRGLIRPGFRAEAGLKIADVDPRGERSHCFTVSDKALAVGGGVLEALLRLAPGART